MKLSANFAMSREIYMHAYLTRKCRPLHLNIFRQWCSRWLETATAGKLRQLFSRARNAIGLLMPFFINALLRLSRRVCHLEPLSVVGAVVCLLAEWVTSQYIFVCHVGVLRGGTCLYIQNWSVGVSRVGLQEGFPNVANIYIFFFFFFSEHIIVRTSLPRCVCQIDACPPPLCLLLSSYQTHLGCLSPIFVLGFICFFSWLQFLALLSSLNHCDE